jgi:calcineurin-like phosphoesterase family protein
MRFSALHLSDLHRDLADELDTGTLLDSVERDIAKCGGEDPPILRPSLCVVTGDMVYGASPTATAAAANDELARQYAQTLDFLVRLADRLFAGARDRVVILPGNHDVALPAFLGSVDRVAIPAEANEKARLVEELFAPRSRLRWSWRELCFYRIVNEASYRSRLEHFSKLYSSFYAGKRMFALDPESQHDAFDFPDLGFCVLSLSSCYNNDPLRRAGAFHPAAITEVCRFARAPARAGHLIAAAWHHNLSGGPAQDDYVESGVLQILIDSGISVAFHGHQHVTECVEERYRVGPNPRKITIISAGTLCAGPQHLAPGEPRSFNIVEFDTEAWTGRVHQRHMVNRVYSLPMWGPGHFNSTNASYLDFRVDRPIHVRPPDLDVHLALERADRLLGAERWAEALGILRPHRAIPLARPLTARALSEIGDSHLTIDVLSPATTIGEAVLIGGAIYESGTRIDAEAFLATPIVSDTDDASVREIARRVRERRVP